MDGLTAQRLTLARVVAPYLKPAGPGQALRTPTAASLFGSG